MKPMGLRLWGSALIALVLSSSSITQVQAFVAPSVRFPIGVQPSIPTKTSVLAMSTVPAAATTEMTKLELKGLQADRFRHPLDRQATEQLRRLPGLGWTVRQFLGVVEEAVYLDNIANGVLVGPKQMRPIHDLLLQACKVLDISTIPEVYVKQNPVPNAYTLAVSGKKPFIVIHTSLIDLLTPKELQAVIAHELGHIKCEHGLWITAANALAIGAYTIGGGIGEFFGDRLRGLLLVWQRAAEFSCDRAALLVAQDLDVVLSALLKLVGGSKSQANELNPQEFLKQARAFELASRSPLGRLFRMQVEPQMTHPLPIIRVQQLDSYYRGTEYTGILRRGTPLEAITAEAEQPAPAIAAAATN